MANCSCAIDRLSIRIGAQVKGWEPEAHFNRQQLVLYDRFTQFTLHAAAQALGQSGLNFDGRLGYKAGVILSTAGGGVNTWDDNYTALTAKPEILGALRP